MYSICICIVSIYSIYTIYIYIHSIYVYIYIHSIYIYKILYLYTIYTIYILYMYYIYILYIYYIYTIYIYYIYTSVIELPELGISWYHPSKYSYIPEKKHGTVTRALNYKMLSSVCPKWCIQSPRLCKTILVIQKRHQFHQFNTVGGSPKKARSSEFLNTHGTLVVSGLSQTESECKAPT
jgi:hypothetical protein